jgi:uncharacterized membrane protein YhaH (DUF805 family)
MSGGLLALLSAAALGASLGLLAAMLGWSGLADVLVGTAALSGLGAFALVARLTVRRARQLDRRATSAARGARP